MSARDDEPADEWLSYEELDWQRRIAEPVLPQLVRRIDIPYETPLVKMLTESKSTEAPLSKDFQRWLERPLVHPTCSVCGQQILCDTAAGEHVTLVNGQAVTGPCPGR